MSTFGDMKSRIADELSRSDLTTQIGLEILTAISHYETERWSWSEQRATASTVTSTAFIALPTDFLDEDSLMITINGSKDPVRRVGYEYIDKIDSGDYTGEPSVYAFYDGQIRLYPIPDRAYTITLSYLKAQTALSADADTNDWTNEGEALIRARAKAAVRINYLNDAAAKQEMMAVGPDFLCAAEASAYKSLKIKSDRRTGTNAITPYCV